MNQILHRISQKKLPLNTRMVLHYTLLILPSAYDSPSLLMALYIHYTFFLLFSFCLHLYSSTPSDTNSRLPRCTRSTLPSNSFVGKEEEEIYSSVRNQSLAAEEKRCSVVEINLRMVSIGSSFRERGRG